MKPRMRLADKDCWSAAVAAQRGTRGGKRLLPRLGAFQQRLPGCRGYGGEPVPLGESSPRFRGSELALAGRGYCGWLGGTCRRWSRYPTRVLPRRRGCRVCRSPCFRRRG